VRLRAALAELTRRFEPDIVHVFHSGPGVFFQLKTAHVHPAPMVFTLHQTYVDSLVDDASVRGRLMRSADWVIACSQSVLDHTRAQLPEITPRSSVLWNSLAMPPIEPTSLPFDPPMILCLGRVLHQKGFDIALSAFATLAGEFPRARLVVAGDGEAREALERQAAALGVERAVDMMGWVAPDDVPALINRCTIVAMPSRIEPFGLVALQAAQMARPIIASRVDGLPEVVAHGDSGLLVEPEDIEGVAAAMRVLLSDPARATAMGEAARRRAEEVFGWDAHVAAYEALYCRIVAREHLHG
jgi:glycogen(starch) synthase